MVAAIVILLRVMGVLKLVDWAFQILLVLQRYMIRLMALPIILGLFVIFAIFVNSVFQKFMPGGSLYTPLPGARTSEMLSYILPSNTSECIVVILSCYGAVMVFKYSSSFIRHISGG